VCDILHSLQTGNVQTSESVLDSAAKNQCQKLNEQTDVLYSRFRIPENRFSRLCFLTF